MFERKTSIYRFIVRLLPGLLLGSTTIGPPFLDVGEYIGFLEDLERYFCLSGKDKLLYSGNYLQQQLQ